jgi:hypothetical protein
LVEEVNPDIRSTMSIYEPLKHEEEARPRIYLVTEGLKSNFTKATYRITFQTFINETVKNPDLGVLLDLKTSVIESKIISLIKYLKMTRN